MPILGILSGLSRRRIILPDEGSCKLLARNCKKESANFPLIPTTY